MCKVWAPRAQISYIATPSVKRLGFMVQGADRLGVGDVLGHDLAHLGEVPPVPALRLRLQGVGQGVRNRIILQGSKFRV